VNGWSAIIQNWLYPPTCLLCGDAGWAGHDLCVACRADLPSNTPACPRCGSLLSGPVSTDCGACQRKPPAFDATVAAFRYEEPIRHLIHGLKFQARYAAARLLGDLLADALAGCRDLPRLLIPVPLHRSRYRERGFNQSLEIARVVSARLHIALDYLSCERIRPTVPQTELSAAERARNIKQAFRVNGSLRGLHVAVLDDVVTTGATVNELARTLRKAGASRIDVWACARA
jgi:ComF family protein